MKKVILISGAVAVLATGLASCAVEADYSYGYHPYHYHHGWHHHHRDVYYYRY